METKTILVDPDVQFMEQLAQALTDAFPTIQILDTYQHYDKLPPSQSQKADLLVINIPDRDFLTNLVQSNAYPCDMIFTAPTYEYASAAISIGAAGYISKPLKQGEVINTMTHYINQRYQDSHTTTQAQDATGQPPLTSLICVPTIQGAEFFRAREIIRCEGLQKCTRIVAHQRSDVVSSYHIGVFRELLGGENFVQPHKSHIINLNYIRKYHREGTIHMSDGSTVPLSRRRKADFFNRMRTPHRLPGTS